MFRFSGFGWQKSRQQASRPSPRQRRRGNRSVPPRQTVLRVETLEDRALPSTFTVLNLLDSGPGSLRAAVTSANTTPGADVIQFAPGLKGTIPLASELSITHNLTINGPGASQLTVSGGNTTQVFAITGIATNVTISGLTIANGQAVTGGGIDNAGTLTLRNCTLSANQSLGSAAAPTETSPEGGGAILNEAGATLTLDHSTLTGNIANALNNTVDVFGGGLLNEGSATISSCTFSGNQATGGGGGSFFGGSVGGAIDNYGGARLTLSNSSFLNNQALASADSGSVSFAMAGALSNDAGLDQAHPSTAIISNCTFSGSLAGGVAGVNGAGAFAQGGALVNQGPGASMTVSNCTLTGNQAVGGSAAGAGFAEGGAIMNIGGYLFPAPTTLTVTNSSFVGNEALGGGSETQGLGGAIHNEEYLVAPPTATFTTPEFANISNCLFAGNVAGGVAGVSGVGGFGGGLNNAGAGATMTVSNCDLRDNRSVGGNGGGINNATAATLAVTNSSFIGNEALDVHQQVLPSGASGGSTAGGGGAIANEAAALPTAALTATINNCTFLGNVAAGSAGFDGNGGALFNEGVAATMTVSNSTLIGNEALGGDGGPGINGGDGVGGGIYDAGILVLSNSTLDDNSAVGGNGGAGANGGDGLGGGLAVQSGASATLSASTITHNKAVGGAEGAGGSGGHGIGGGVYNLGTFSADVFTVIKKNHASTSNDDLFP
jgi:hypothetical protein